ncbi:MAG: hypothetical protein JXQ30_02370 [Spirochaetes bacterium]|nr:hypothetical protein [Spirochaetota bacterium]
MTRRIVYLPLIMMMTAAILFFGCATARPKVEQREALSEIVENGVGKAKLFDDALALAFRDALRKVVLEAIGPEPERQNSERIKTYVYDIAETFIVRYEVTDKVKSGKDTIVYARVAFDGDKVKESIRTIGVEVPEPREKKDYSESPYEPLILEALDNLTYLVYFEPEKRRIEDEYARLCVNRVNNYLAGKEYEYVDLERINEIKEEYFTLYEETQGAVSVVQLIAQALNADVYIVVDGIVEGEGKSGDIHFASASIDLKAFESATGRGLGTETGYSGRLGLASGMDAAKRKGVEVAVENAVRPTIDLVRNYMYKSFEEGIRYEVVVQGLGDYSMATTFRDALSAAGNFRSLKEVSVSAGQAKYYVYYMGRKPQLIDEVLANLQNEEGFENLTVLVSRGNAVIFGIEE